jgi:hypothetical protein
MLGDQNFPKLRDVINGWHLTGSVKNYIYLVTYVYLMGSIFIMQLYTEWQNFHFKKLHSTSHQNPTGNMVKKTGLASLLAIMVSISPTFYVQLLQMLSQKCKNTLLT